MLLPSGLSAYSFRVDNWGANPATTFGTLLTSNASANAYGSYSTLIADTSITQDCYWMHVQVHSGATSASARNTIIDIAVDPAGGTSFVDILRDIVCGDSPSPTAAGTKSYVFPYFIRAGSELGARIKCSVASATCRVAVKLYGQPSHPQNVPVGASYQSLATFSNSNGSSFTPGNAADGTWVDLGATTKPLWWWQLGHQIDNGTITAEYTYIEVAFGDATNKHIFMKAMHGGTTGEVAAPVTNSHITTAECYFPVPAGVNVYVRGRCNNAPDTGYNAAVIGIGG